MAPFPQSWLQFGALLLLLALVQGQILNGNVYVEKQLLCALDRAPCDNLGRQIKDALPEIIGKNCKACDNKQLSNAKRIARFVQNKYPNVWNDLVRKYGNPTN
ncbi:allergen Tha p 1 [Dendroctonus ponderosae]|uniref:Chemosensory protein 11 n=1 Tax=Dendroctonus ponderosae TaxID=77166 RepID=M4VUV8_DENPD